MGFDTIIINLVSSCCFTHLDKTWLMRPDFKGNNCHFNIYPGNICPRSICPDERVDPNRGY